ncbi:hypothetical protein FVEG_03343 [Fusarium verticillioides 7600]|uniref:alcohol dehydrogenase n=1 Tax=Gibberella moniliformis (strain M3125 / FGSC 7600) TaxID=334819 RepID=W7LP59_GIBM7|nr:hypothetical protein FVEG_03343 [Fusarium verticillioides 7600]EWG41188.1 hypothetical protein FVEG_03343 [Fusarium verticillioides 7600]
MLGHEVAGLVRKLGRNVSGYQIGDSVTLALLMHPVSERINGAYVGLSLDGGYGQYVVAPQKILVKIPDAQGYGAKDCFASLDDATNAGLAFDIIVDFFGHFTTTSAAIKAVKPGGKVVTVGLASSDVTIPSNTGSVYILKGLTIVGSIGASMRDLKDVLTIIAEGSITPELNEGAFEGIPETIKQLAEGTVAGRVWTDPSKTLFQ